MSSWVPICFHNISTQGTKMPAHTLIGQVQAANRVPNKLPPKVIKDGETETTVEVKPKGGDETVLEIVGLSCANSWPPEN